MRINKNLKFDQERLERIKEYQHDVDWNNSSNTWMQASVKNKYVYNFDWLGRPIIQFPQDIIALQEVIWKVKPDLIIETGIAHGGSLTFSASMLALLDINENSFATKRRVVGIDIDIRKHNREALEAHPLRFMMKLIEGSSISDDVHFEVTEYSKKFKNILVILDSMHTHEHVAKELELYSKLVSSGSYCIVLDTFVESFDTDLFPDRPWTLGDNPKTAVNDFISKSHDFMVDKSLHQKLMISSAPDGFLKKS